MSGKKEYNTKQGSMIIGCLRRHGSVHLSADEIYEELRADGAAVGRTTVYRHLDRLCDSGLVRRINAGEGRGACFQLVDGDGCADHYHMICTGCGALSHISCDAVDEFAEHLFRSHGFLLDNSRTLFYGLCADCAKKKQEKGKE